jgi:hypothetical protein
LFIQRELKFLGWHGRCLSRAIDRRTAKSKSYFNLHLCALCRNFWFSLYKTGVHPTLAGVILGLMTPNIAHHKTDIEDIEDGSVSVIEWLEHNSIQSAHFCSSSYLHLQIPELSSP